MSVELKVKKSRVTKGGRTRLCKDAFDELELHDGDDIVVTSDEKSVAVKAFSDDLVEKDHIYLRKDEMNQLKVKEEDIVTVSPHQAISEKLKEKVPWPKKDKTG